ncbi:putative moxR protein [Mycobacteroides abscessus subsp. abscessus]|nr:putative moxR protein [Mycobacteroides abscessus subsp. abscessus]
MVRLQRVASNVFVHHALVDYVVRVIAATRTPREVGLEDVAGWIAYGASPRATLGIIAASRALALVRGRDYVVPQDVIEVIPDVLRHRLVLSYDAMADEVRAHRRHLSSTHRAPRIHRAQSIHRETARRSRPLRR